LDGLTTGRLDLLLLAVPLGVPGVVELPLFDEDFVLVTPLGHPLGGRSGIPREALRVDAPVTTTAAGLSTLVQLVAGGLGVTLLPRTAVRVETTRSDQLLTGYFTEPAPTRRIAFAMRTGAARRAEYQELAAALREALRPLPVRVLGTGN